jgi:hypothetical protein
MLRLGFFAISVAFKTSPPLLAKKSPTEIESLLVLFVIKNKPNGSKTKNCKSKSIKKQSNNEQQPGPSKENTKVVNFDNGCDISDEDVSF